MLYQLSYSRLELGDNKSTSWAVAMQLPTAGVWHCCPKALPQDEPAFLPHFAEANPPASVHLVLFGAGKR